MFLTASPSATLSSIILPVFIWPSSPSQVQPSPSTVAWMHQQNRRGAYRIVVSAFTGKPTRKSLSKRGQMSSKTSSTLSKSSKKSHNSAFWPWQYRFSDSTSWLLALATWWKLTCKVFYYKQEQRGFMYKCCEECVSCLLLKAIKSAFKQELRFRRSPDLTKNVTGGANAKLRFCLYNTVLTNLCC